MKLQTEILNLYTPYWQRVNQLSRILTIYFNLFMVACALTIIHLKGTLSISADFEILLLDSEVNIFGAINN